MQMVGCTKLDQLLDASGQRLEPGTHSTRCRRQGGARAAPGWHPSRCQLSSHRRGASHDGTQALEIPQQHLAPQAARRQLGAAGRCGQACDIVRVARQAAQAALVCKQGRGRGTEAACSRRRQPRCRACKAACTSQRCSSRREAQRSKSSSSLQHAGPRQPMAAAHAGRQAGAGAHPAHRGARRAGCGRWSRRPGGRAPPAPDRSPVAGQAGQAHGSVTRHEV